MKDVVEVFHEKLKVIEDERAALWGPYWKARIDKEKLTCVELGFDAGDATGNLHRDFEKTFTLTPKEEAMLRMLAERSS